ncbi:putative glycoside hydrolase [Uliginosibacterium gangwonense]|uniref:putative glycoside hydrolase n=1 Tax=Uliginosibacterium gangwonense TaxID=392736 RepID=UPI00039FE091|nr:putative glycoside hydrolase [Uliginosibacterium gangwonense]
MKSTLLVFFMLIALTSPLAHALRGQVVDDANGRPLAGAVVVRGTEVVTTNQEGAYNFVGNGGTIAARAIGYRRAMLTLANSATEAPPLRLMAFRPKALYLTFWGIGDRHIRGAALDIARSTEINALVIDVKGDRGWIPYPSHVKLAETIGARGTTTVKDMPALIAQLKALGLYLIARVVVFKDDPLASAHPEWAVKTAHGTPYRDREGLGWTDAGRPEVWAYNLDIAEEAAQLGFDEIQFDYLRFPDAVGLTFAEPNTEEKRVAAISGFLAAARKRLAPYNVFIAGDIFGYVLWNENDTYIGQKLEALETSLDYISPMLYPTGFHLGIPGYVDPVAHPREIVQLTLEHAIHRTHLSPLRFRPWLQSFRDYAFDRRNFGGPEIRLQIDGAEKVGTDGWMFWNPHNTYTSDGLKKK